MAEPPDAFLSYTRFDDRTARSAQFRQWLSDIVREASGEPFEIFPGRRRHRPRGALAGKLDEILDHARFFIPIMTPIYFKSEACRNELEKFLAPSASPAP